MLKNLVLWYGGVTILLFSAVFIIGLFMEKDDYSFRWSKDSQTCYEFYIVWRTPFSYTETMAPVDSKYCEDIR